MLPPQWQKPKPQQVQGSHPGQIIALEDVSNTADGSAWSADPVRSTCCLQ